MDKPVRLRILYFLEEVLPYLANPRARGKPLFGKFTGFWRYRVGDYRLLARIKDSEVTVLVIEIKHRREAYK